MHSEWRSGAQYKESREDHDSDDGRPLTANPGPRVTDCRRRGTGCRHPQFGHHLGRKDDRVLVRKVVDVSSKITDNSNIDY